MRLFWWVCYTSPPFGILKLCFSKTGTFIVCKPGSLQEISCQQTQSCVNLCHGTCGMGFFTILQKGILRLFQSSGLMYDTTCDLCFVFSVPIFTTTSFCLVSTNPRHFPNKNDPCFPAFVLTQPNQPTRVLDPGFPGRTPSKATSLSASLYLSLLQLLRRDYVNAFAELDRSSKCFMFISGGSDFFGGGNQRSLQEIKR